MQSVETFLRLQFSRSALFFKVANKEGSRLIDLLKLSTGDYCLEDRVVEADPMVTS